MDMNTKLEICRLKFCGESVISISEITGFTKQCIYTFIRKFPRSGRSVPVTRPKDITEEQVKAYCRDYISGRRVVSSRPKYYNALAKWMRSHGYSQRTFAAELGIPISRLKDVFAGYRHMDAELGQRISNMTGIPLKELYADVLPPKS